MPDYDVREALCEIGRRCWQRGFVGANDGNFSYRLDAERILATPTRLSKGSLTPEDLVVIDLDGNQVDGTRKSTSEIRLHLNAYRRRPDIRSVVHVHPPHATAFAVAGIAPPQFLLEESELYLGPVPLVPYLPTGTWEFARGLDPWIETHDAFLLSNHGAVTFGLDPFDAYYKMEVLDHGCRIIHLAASLPGCLPGPDLATARAMLGAKARHGLRDPREGLTDEQLLAPAPMPRRGAPAEPAWPERLEPGQWPRVPDEPALSSPPPPEPEGMK